MSEAVFQTKITAKDDTGKGVKAAEKTIGQLPRQAAVHGKRAMSEMDSAVTKSGRGILSTFTKMERASASAIGGGGGVISRLSSVASVASSAGSGLGEAAAGAGLLEGAMGALAGAGAIAAGVIAGVVVGTDKLVGSWAKGVLGASNLAATIGVTTKALQEFQAAGERVGVDKGTAAGAISGLSGTLNDARYGRNPAAMAVLARLGVGMKTNKDGTVNTEAMIPAIADAIKRQNSSGQRTVARALGIGEGALAMFRQGGAALSGDMADAGLHANVATLGEIQSARKWTRQRARLGQMAERVGDRAGAWGADHAQGALDGAVDFGGSAMDSGGQNIVRGAETFSRSVVNKFAPAVDRLIGAVGGGGLPSGSAMRPGQSHINSPFGPRARPRLPGGGFGSAFHQGVDFRAADGTPIGASAAGTVIGVSHQHGYGQVVEISHGGGRSSFYAHLSRPLVKVGDRVAAGQRIALSGHDGGGHPVEPHLHYGEKLNGHWVNPYGAGSILASGPQVAAMMNNPGGIMGKDGRFNRYPSAMDGARAMAANLAAYQDKHGIDTIDGIAQRWAPRGHGGNNPDVYAAHMATWTGLGRGQHLNLHDPRTQATLIAAQMRQESGIRADAGELRIIIEDHRVVAKRSTKGGHAPAVSHAMLPR